MNSSFINSFFSKDLFSKIELFVFEDINLGLSSIVKFKITIPEKIYPNILFSILIYFVKFTLKSLIVEYLLSNSSLYKSEILSVLFG